MTNLANDIEIRLTDPTQVLLGSCEDQVLVALIDHSTKKLNSKWHMPLTDPQHAYKPKYSTYTTDGALQKVSQNNKNYYKNMRF